MRRLGERESEFRIFRVGDDIAVAEAVRESAPDILIHTACSYGRQDEPLLAIFDANLRFGVQLMQSALALNRPVTFINTGTVIDRNVSDYALSKVQFSEWGKSMAARCSNRLTFVNVLLQHMYGPGDDATKFSTRIIQRCLSNDPHIPLTPGGQQRDFIYVDDVVSAYSALVRHASAWQSSSVDVEVGSGEAPTIREFVELVHRLTGSSARLDFGALPYRPNEGMRYQADLSRMHSLGWLPRVALAEGLRRTIQAEQEAVQAARPAPNPDAT